MKLLLSCLLCLVSQITIAQTSAYDVRRVRWGMTRSQVLKSEVSRPKMIAPDGVVYITTIGGCAATANYLIKENKLYGFAYNFLLTKHTNDNLYLDDYTTISELLQRKYGDTGNGRIEWRDDTFKADRTKWGLALSMGHLKINTTWETETSLIIHSISGDNYDITHVVSYIPKKAIGSMKQPEEDL